jgi:hypothetical protein
VGRIAAFEASLDGQRTAAVPTWFLQVYVSPYESCWQTECQLFVLCPLRIGRGLPRIRNESRPAKLVMVVTDF